MFARSEISREIVYSRDLFQPKLLVYAISTKVLYSNYSKISNTFLFLFSVKMLVFGAGIHKMLVGIANREDPDQTAFSEAV